jgi:hypothetical protein
LRKFIVLVIARRPCILQCGFPQLVLRTSIRPICKEQFDFADVSVLGSSHECGLTVIVGSIYIRPG